MKNKSEENIDYLHLRHSAKSGESYYLTILDESGIHTINLSDFNKEQLFFGHGPTNDIIIDSANIDYNQGYLQITDYGVLAVNTSPQFPMISNNNKAFKDLYLQEGGFIKIVDPREPSIQGVIMIMSINENLDEWKPYPLVAESITIGSSNTCDIILSPTGVAKRHASIYHSKNKNVIVDEYSTNGIYINGSKIPAGQRIILHNLDIILIGNSKIVLFDNKIYYQIFERGIRLEAFDIIKDVRIKFKTKRIASNVNMDIKPSEFVAFVGGSGAGKSTFMKCISGVTPPSSGTVLMNGENLYENYQNLKYNIGYVPQDDIVFPNLTLNDMLQYAAKLRMPDNATPKERNTRIKEVLEIVQLSDFENSYIRQLSGGQRKRASIAVELIADPNLFFLDEPTSGLDPGTERSIMNTLRNMSRMGKTIILVTHNTLNLHLCDKVAFFGQGGHLCFYGAPQDALTFFGVDDFVDIYNLISEDMTYWYEKFQELQKVEKSNLQKSKERTNLMHKGKSFFKQLATLVSRYIKLIANDRQQLLLLFAQAPIVAIFLSVVTNSKLYVQYEDTKAILFSIGCASIWLGLMNSVQEICKEKVILQKEYMSDLKLSAYLLSKFIVQGILAFIQALLLVFIFQAIAGKSQYSILINPFWDMQIICFLSILSSASMGLFISSIVKNANIAMSVIPLVLVPHLLFSGMLFELEGLADKFSNLILCRWTVEGLGTSANLNGLTHLIQTYFPNAKLEPEAYFLFTQDHMFQVIGVILLMTTVLLIGSYIMLRKNVTKNM